MNPVRGGTQSIERSIRLMRALAARARFGWRLSDLARHCEIDKGTARRILNCLVRERLAERSATDQRYLPGPLMFELGLALPELDEFKAAALPLLERLGAQTHTAAFLCLRSGDDVVCAARAGEVPDAAFTLNVGTRRPLANSSAGAALLITLPDTERNEIFERNCKVLAQHGFGARGALDRLLKRSLETGMGYNESCFVPGWNSYSQVLRNEREAWASVMISASASQFTPGLLDAALAALARITRQLQELSETLLNRQRRPVLGQVNGIDRTAEPLGERPTATGRTSRGATGTSAVRDHATPN